MLEYVDKWNLLCSLLVIKLVCLYLWHGGRIVSRYKSVCSESHAKHINTVCGQNAEFLILRQVVHVVTTVLQILNQLELFHFVSYDKVSSVVGRFCFYIGILSRQRRVLSRSVKVIKQWQEFDVYFCCKSVCFYWTIWVLCCFCIHNC
jgi:hypothetical protein